MLIANDYLLMLPGFFEDSLDHIALYPVDSLLALRTSDRQLTGHPSEDLGDDWLVVQFDASKAEKWTQQDRLIKVRPNAREGYRVTYVERREWQRYLTEADWRWLQTVCDCAAVHTDTVLAEQAEQASREAIVRVLQGVCEIGTEVDRQMRRTTKAGKKARKRARVRREVVG